VSSGEPTVPFSSGGICLYWVCVENYLVQQLEIQGFLNEWWLYNTFIAAIVKTVHQFSFGFNLNIFHSKIIVSLGIFAKGIDTCS